MTSILDYHAATKHSPESVRRNRHMLDWENQPLPFKVYETLPPLPLPRSFAEPAMPTLAALAADGAGTVATPDLGQLAALLQYSAGITRKREYPGGQVMYFRAAACTGALYHIDLYLVCSELPGLAAGVYHFGPHDFALRQLRAGDCRRVLVEASGAETALGGAPVILVAASTFWRNAWKYQARTYRHAWWDSGTLLANLLAVAASSGIPARVVVGFADAPVNQLLGIDGREEAALALVPLGAASPPPPPPPPLPTLELRVRPLSPRRVDYPLIAAAHAATALTDGAAAAAWRTARWPVAPAPPAGEPVTLGATRPASPPLGVTILRRGSARRFARRAIDRAQLAALLHAATRGVPGDWAPGATPVAQPFVIVNAVDDLAPGTYRYDPRVAALVPLHQGELRERAGFLALGQSLAADAAVNVYLLADCDPLIAAVGPRAYRAVSLDAAITGGKLYLAAYALGIGATGLTFFDDEVIRAFGPAADGAEVLFLVAAGPRAARQRRTE